MHSTARKNLLSDCILSPSSSCSCASAAGSATEGREGEDDHTCSSLNAKKRRMLKCRLADSLGERVVFKEATTPTTGGRITISREPQFCCTSNSNLASSHHKNGGATITTMHNPTPVHSFHQGRSYPAEKQIRRRFNRRYSKVGKMFYENDSRTLLYLTSVSPNFGKNHNSQGSQMEGYDEIMNKMESSMNVR